MSNENPNTLQLDLDVYPNPATEVLHFDWEADKPESAQLQIYDLQGRLIIASQGQPARSEMDVRIAPMVANGTYVYNLKVGDRARSGRIVIAR